MSEHAQDHGGHAPLVPALADHGALAMSEAELRDWGHRLGRPDQLDALAWDEIVSARALVLIEWPDRAGDRLPNGRVTLSLQHLPDDPARRLLYAGWHP